MMEDSRSCFNVSRETMERLEVYVHLLNKWASRINLVSKNSMEDVWNRHVADSLQVLEAARGYSGSWVDVGSGAGFPGLVVALSKTLPDPVTLIESDIRKATFLRTVLRETEVHAHVIVQRIEDTPPQSAKILSARALAPLPKLIEYARRHLAPEGIAIFPKGKTWKKEVEAARNSFSFEIECISSETQEGAAILRIGAISCVNG